MNVRNATRASVVCTISRGIRSCTLASVRTPVPNVAGNSRVVMHWRGITRALEVVRAAGALLVHQVLGKMDPMVSGWTDWSIASSRRKSLITWTKTWGSPVIVGGVSHRGREGTSVASLQARTRQYRVPRPAAYRGKHEQCTRLHQGPRADSPHTASRAALWHRKLASHREALVPSLSMTRRGKSSLRPA